MGMTQVAQSDRAREADLTRQIALLERRAVLLAGRTFSDAISVSDLKLIEDRMTLLDDARDQLLIERACIRRARWGLGN